MLQWLRDIVGKKHECPACTVYRTYLEDVLRERDRYRDSLYRHLHLDVPSPTPIDPPQILGQGKAVVHPMSWPKMRAELESRHRRATPEEVVKDYWEQKNKETEEAIAEIDAKMKEVENASGIG